MYIFAALVALLASTAGLRSNCAHTLPSFSFSRIFGAGAGSHDVWRQKIGPGPSNKNSEVNINGANAPLLTDIDELETAQTDAKGSGIEAYLQECTRLIGKTPLVDLKAYVTKLSMPALSMALTDDFEEVASQALDLAWRHSQGNWTTMLQTLNQDLGPLVAEIDVSLAQCIKVLNTLSEADLKSLIVRLAPEGLNALPKLNKKKFQGKFVKADYIAEVLDVVRVQQGNDYRRVLAVLEGEKREKKGFGG